MNIWIPIISIIFILILTLLFYRRKIVDWFKAHKKLGAILITIMVAAPTGALLYLGDQPIEPPLPEPPTIQPYYFQFDSNIPGAFGRYVLNPEYCRQWLKDNFFWRLQASADNSTWQNANQLLKIDINYDDANLTAKLTLTLNTTLAPKALYYRFDLACNASMKEYLNESTLSQWNFKVPVGDRDMFVYFNWSDIKPLIQSGKVFFKHGIKTVEGQDYFWFRIQTRNKIPVGTVFVVDPTYGLIADAVTNSWEYDEQEGRYPDMIRLGTSEYYAIVSTGDSGTENDGYIRTIRVWNNNGTIKTSLVDSWEYDTSDGYYPNILYWGGSTYLIDYGDYGAGNIDKVFTVNISSTNGTITKSAGDTLNFYHISAFGNDLIRVNGNLFAYVQSDAVSYDLFLYTFFVNASNDISGVIDSVGIDTIDGQFPRMCMVDSDTVAIVYDSGINGGNDGYMSTWNISATGDITNTYSAFWEFDTAKGGTPTIAKVTGNIFMVAYEDTNSDLFVKTCQINNTGGIWNSWKDTQGIDATNGDYPTFFNVSYNAIPNKWVKGISFSGEGSDGYVSTFDVDSTGAIGSEIDTLTFGADTVAWYIPTCFVSGFFFLSIHVDASLDGWAKTFQIYANNPPTISNPSPANGATGIATIPQLSVNVSDIGDYLNATWSSNSSGSWHKFDWNSSFPSYGAISDSVVNSYEYNKLNGMELDAIKLGNDATFSYFAIVSNGNANDGFINTTKVWNSNGTIYPGNVDSYEYDASDGETPSICLVSGNIYAICYLDIGATKLKVITVDITSLGDITNSIIDTISLTSYVDDFSRSDIIKFNGHIFACSYTGSASDGYIDTIWINDSGTINDTVLDSVEFDIVDSDHPSMCIVDSDTVLICSGRGVTSGYGHYLYTINISGTGDITNTVADSWLIEASSSYSSSGQEGVAYKLSANTYLCVYADGDTPSLIISTVTIADTGMITKTVIDKYVPSDANLRRGRMPTILPLGNDLYAITIRSDLAALGYVTTIKVSPSGDIACFEYDTLCFTGTNYNLFFATILPVANDYYYIVYEGTDNDGWSCTVRIGNDTTTTLKQTNANFSAASTKYYWRVNVSDGVNANYSIYSFTTAGGGANNPPTIALISPANASTNIALNPSCRIWANDTDSTPLTAKWYTNKTGTWTLIKTYSANITANSRTNYTFTNFNTASTKYYWRVLVNDSSGGLDNHTFYFTTIANDTTPPSITINFAGNHSDKGGPYWQPPGESTALSGANLEGYYTNDSRQHEDWIYVNTTVVDAESAVTNVWLQWLNKTGTNSVWTNWTYAFVHGSGNYWAYNTSGNIATKAGSNYSFNIVANSSGGSKNIRWNKTVGTGFNAPYLIRRFVGLNNLETNISYLPFYLREAYGHNSYTVNKKDTMHHDQSSAANRNDTGFVVLDNYTNKHEEIYCGGYFTTWYDEKLTVKPGTIQNIYYHLWWNVSGYPGNIISIGYNKSRDYVGYEDWIQDFSFHTQDEVSKVRTYASYETGPPGLDYYIFSLNTRLFDIIDFNFTDNDIFEFAPIVGKGSGVVILGNKSICSFLIFNVPSNATLNASYADSDLDGLSDWTELYVSYTNPFLADTDNDGQTDWNETQTGSDPNNYTDTIVYTPAAPPSGRYWTETIRNSGIDYFVWLGSNCTAYNVTLQLTGFDEVAEYVAIWKNTTWNGSYGAWQRYFGDKTGINFTIHTFDVVEVYLTDAGTQTFNMNENLSSSNYTNSKTYQLRNSTKNYGWNYSGYNRPLTVGTTLSAINTSIDLPDNYYIALWNETNYAWDYWISGFWEINKNVWMWDVILSKVEASRTWVT